MKRVLKRAEADRAAAVFEEHRRFIESVAARHSPSPDDVPDIVQSVGMLICTRLGGFRSEAAITTWLYRITVNEAIGEYRRQDRFSRLKDSVASVPDDISHPDDDLVRSERIGAVRDAIQSLPEGHRSLLGDILREPDVLPGSRQNRYRARRQLREVLSSDPRLNDE